MLGLYDAKYGFTGCEEETRRLLFSALLRQTKVVIYKRIFIACRNFCVPPIKKIPEYFAEASEARKKYVPNSCIAASIPGMRTLQVRNPKTHFPMPTITPDPGSSRSKTQQVREMFDRISGHYDF